MTIRLIKVKTLESYTLHSLDGEIGKVNEFYFDDHHLQWSSVFVTLQPNIHKFIACFKWS
jgi:hypothetical protein